MEPRAALCPSHPFFVCVCVCTEKSRAFSPHSEAKKQALAPDDLRAPGLGRPVLSSYPMSPRDQHLLHLNCESLTHTLSHTHI